MNYTSAADRLKIINNIIARSGGIENIDLSSELAKSLSAVNAMRTRASISDMQNMAKMRANQEAGGTISPEMSQSIPEQSEVPQTEQSQPPMQNEGQGTLNLPPQM